MRGRERKRRRECGARTDKKGRSKALSMHALEGMLPLYWPLATLALPLMTESSSDSSP